MYKQIENHWTHNRSQPNWINDLYNKLNQKYFNGSLPEIMISWNFRSQTQTSKFDIVNGLPLIKLSKEKLLMKSEVSEDEIAKALYKEMQRFFLYITWPNVRLTELYNELNQRCFEGDLPEIQINWSIKPVKNYVAYFTPKIKKGFSLEEEPSITLIFPAHIKDDQIDEAEINSSLLHEMSHAWLYFKGLKYGHTPAFYKKLLEVGGTRSTRTRNKKILISSSQSPDGIKVEVYEIRPEKYDPKLKKWIEVKPDVAPDA